MHARQLSTFVAAASTLNFSRAAEMVHLAPSSVSEQIQALEAELGTALFDRSRRALSLTPAGGRFLDYARELLSLWEEARAAVAEVAGETRGAIAIGSLETLAARWLPSILTPFQREYPEITVNVKVSGSGHLKNAVRSGELDLCFTFGAAPADPRLLHRNMGSSEIVAIMPAERAPQKGAPGSLAQLADQPFIVTEVGCIYRQIVEDAFTASGSSRPRIVAEVGSLAAIQNMVGAGLGCAIVPRAALPDAGSAFAVVPLDEIDAVPITMIWRQRRVQPPAIRQFLGVMRGC